MFPLLSFASTARLPMVGQRARVPRRANIGPCSISITGRPALAVDASDGSSGDRSDELPLGIRGAEAAGASRHQ